MKALGIDIKKFWLDGFPEGYYHEDDEIIIEDEYGNWNLLDDEKYQLSKLGIIVSEVTGDVKSFSYFFRKWQKQKASTAIILEIDNSLANSDVFKNILNQLENLGVKVLR